HNGSLPPTYHSSTSVLGQKLFNRIAAAKSPFAGWYRGSNPRTIEQSRVRTMKITAIETFMTNFGVSNYIFVKVSTDEGVTGIGEATLEGKELSVLGAIQELSRNLIGENPLLIEHHWRKWHMTSCWKG